MRRNTLFTTFLACVFFTFLSITVVRGETQYEPLMSFKNPGQTITYFNSGEIVKIPKINEQYKRYFKAAYISTNNNIDFPKIEGRKSEDIIQNFKEQYKLLLDELQSNHFNVVIFEIRPLLDSFYESEYNPWSQFLLGKEGQFISGWDPLSFMIEEAHRRRMEFHAHLNTFLVSNLRTSSIDRGSILKTLDWNNFAVKHPDTVLEGNDHRLYLNPADEHVRSYFLNTVLEVVNNYEVDGIHISSSFYPKTGFLNNEDFINLEQNIRENYETIDKFRETQINILLQEIDKLINNANINSGRSVQFGMTIDLDDLYLNEDRLLYHLDYLIPTVNRRFEENRKGFADVVREWVEKLNRPRIAQNPLPNLYIGLDVMFTSTDYERELESYLTHLQVYDHIKGISLKGVVHLQERDEDYEVFERIFSKLYTSSVLLPPVQTVYTAYGDDFIAPSFELQKVEEGIQISWRGEEHAKYYVLYRIPRDVQVQEVGEIVSDPNYIIHMIENNSSQKNFTYVDRTINNDQGYKYMLTIVDRANRETNLPLILDYTPTVPANRMVILTVLIVTSVISLAVIITSSYIVLKK